MKSAIETDASTAKLAPAVRSVRRALFRYGLALGSVAGATALGFLASRLNLEESTFTFFVLAVAVTSWYAGVGPAIAAFVLGSLSFNYYFTAPFFQLAITREDFAYLSVFAFFAALLIWFGVVRRRIEGELRESQEVLEARVLARTEDLKRTSDFFQQEVVERRRMEGKLRERASLLDLTHDTIFVRDMQGAITYWNGGAEALYGWTSQEAVGQIAQDLLRKTFPEPLEEINATLLRTGRWEGEVVHKTRDGTRVVVLSRLSLQRDEQGTPRAVLETNNDITERKNVEEALRRSHENLEIKVRERTAEVRERANLLDLTHDCVFVRNLKDEITFWNRGAEELYGWTPQEAVGQVTHHLLRTIFPEPLSDINASLLRADRWEGELIHATRDGRQVVVASRWSLQRDEHGNPCAILETNNDISKRRAAEEALRRSRDELQFANRELEAFAYSVSHDLRAPVRHIAGFTELVQKHADPVLDDTSRRHIRMILDSARRMGRLVDDLLAFSRISRTEAQMTTVDLDLLVKDVIGNLAPDTEKRKIAWRIGQLSSCHGDPSMMRLVFSNLIANAIKFTQNREQAEIEIGSQVVNGDELVVFVKDNGVGFDMKYKDKLFGVFQRLHSQEEFEGTGIGIATVERIIQRHGGRVWGEGAVDGGATFSIALPMSGKTSV